jgi:hypothetical protein
LAFLSHTRPHGWRQLLVVTIAQTVKEGALGPYGTA